jgi:two-component system, OmpR family, copper resistance phosphate regulon response regulator CusR
MHLLIIEDEPKMANYLAKGLTENGFIVDIANNGEEGIFLATTESYDLIILDVMLPKINGWTVLTTLRNKKLETPVLFLTARDSVADRVKGLELGADDYLIKPFAFSELLARVRTILRRGSITSPDVLEIADLEIDLIRHKAFRNKISLDLSPKEFALLSLLARHNGEVISRTVITEKIWDINFDSGTNVVDVSIRRLRQKVDDNFKNKLIHTIRGVGYVLEDRTNTQK